MRGRPCRDARGAIDQEAEIPILLDIHRGVATLTISNPERRNAWAQDFPEQFAGQFRTISDDDAVRCIVITGDEAGKAFCAGADLKNEKVHRTESAESFLNAVLAPDKSPLALPGACSKPVLASVNGHAVGIGCSLTFCCDLIVASERATWSLPQVGLGVVPKYGSTARLARWVGQGIAMRVALGFPLTATEAAQCGLVQWLVPHKELATRTFEVAEKIASYPPLAVRMVKDSLGRGLKTPDLTDVAVADLFRFAMLEQTEDAREAHDAWRQKRSPRVKGR